MAYKILVVDDEPDLELLIRQRFRRAIRAGEMDFVFAHNGAEALEKLREQPDIPLVLTDINMPQMDGLTLLAHLEELNGDKAKSPIKAVVVSAYGDMVNIRTAMNRGAFDFLTKPIDFQDVEITIAKTLNYIEQLRESRRAEDYRKAKDAAESNYQRLQELESLRDSLVHMLIHDMRTPLTSFSSGLQILERMGDLNDVQRECLTIALSGAECLLGMVNDLLDVSKMEAGLLELKPGKTDPVSLVRGAINQVAYTASSKNIDLRETCPPDLTPLHADGAKLERVLVNLLGNAIKFTPYDGTVTLSVSAGEELGQAPGSLVFSVVDTGRGIPEEAFEQIFEKFGQLEHRETGACSSTGLGLTFCKMVVEAHGGRIWVESEVGQGSRFSFVIPRHALQNRHDNEPQSSLQNE
jgi:signal transduction histidine kinase